MSKCNLELLSTCHSNKRPQFPFCCRFRFAETRRPHASLPTVFKVQPHSSSNENHGNVPPITGDWWHCTVFQLAFTLRRLGRRVWGRGAPIPLWPSSEAFYAVQWRPFSTSAGFLPLCPLQPHRPLLPWIAEPESWLLFSHLLWYSELGPCYQQPVNRSILNQVDGGFGKLAVGSEGPAFGRIKWNDGKTGLKWEKLV